MRGTFVWFDIIKIGAAEDKSFEPHFTDMAKWFMDNQVTDWQQSLREAAKASRLIT